MKGRPFEPGNKMGKGRPPGSRNKRSMYMDLMESYGEAIIKQCQVMALEKNPMAMRLCMERLLAPCKAPNTRFRLPAATTATDLVKALGAVMQQVARGHLSAQEGEAMAGMIESLRHSIGTEEFEQRLQAVENRDPSDSQRHGGNLP
jgi:hypothetical protein